jgi:hypothetical protein
MTKKGRREKPAESDRLPITLSINRCAAYGIIGPGMTALEVADIIAEAGIKPHHYAPSGTPLYDCIEVRKAGKGQPEEEDE